MQVVVDVGVLVEQWASDEVFVLWFGTNTWVILLSVGGFLVLVLGVSSLIIFFIIRRWEFIIVLKRLFTNYFLDRK